MVSLSGFGLGLGLGFGDSTSVNVARGIGIGIGIGGSETVLCIDIGSLTAEAGAGTVMSIIWNLMK